MDDVLTFDTEKNDVQERKSLSLYNEKNPLLKIVAPSFDFAHPPIDPMILAQDMLMTMRHYHGLGLAANQVGLNYRVFVLEGDLICFNPRIVSVSKDLVHDVEGCLSFPGLQLRVLRHSSIDVEYQLTDGTVQQKTFSGITARYFQHELDHLNGTVFTKRVGSLTLEMARKKQKKLFKKIERLQQRKRV